AVRQALYHALDRDTFVALHWPERSDAVAWLPTDHPLFSDTVTLYPFSLATAAGLLDAAGWIDHNGNGIRDKNGVELRFDLAFRGDHPARQDLAAMFQADLATIGVDVTLLALPFDQLYERASRGELDAFMMGWYLDGRYEPGGYTFFHGSQAPTAYNSYWHANFSGWQHPLNDALVAAARTQLDHAALADLYAQQLALVTQELPLWVTSHQPRVSAAVPTLLNFEPHGSMPATWNIAAWELPANPYDLTVRKQLAAGSPAPQPGSTITYSLRVRNAGFFTVTNVVLVDDLPADVVFVSADPPPDAVIAHSLVWQLGDVPGSSPEQRIRVAVHIPPTVTHGTILVNQVSAFGDQPDTHPTNNGFTHQLTVRDDVDLGIIKYGVGQPAIGETYSYYLDYANWGGAPAVGAVVTDTLPPEMMLLSADPPPASVNGGILTWNLPTLNGSQWGGQIALTAEIVGAGTVVNTADVAYPGVDVDPLNNTDTAVAHVADILPPLLLRPTQGTTDDTPTVSGLAPSGAVVDLYDIQTGVTWVASTTATISGTFAVELALPNGTYILAATASKAGFVSSYSNTATLIVDAAVPLDTDTVDISAGGVNISSGSVRAEVRTLAHRTLDVQSALACAAAPTNVFLRVTENALFTYPVPPVSLADQGGGVWLADFNVWLAEPHSSYEIWLEWTCAGSSRQELLIYILIDPDGYVYDQSLVDGGAAIADAILTDAVVTAYVRLNDSWQVWDAALYGQVNPQLTNDTTPDGVLTAGYYSFLTPSGQYRIEAVAPGYQPFQSQVLTVITTPVHLDVGLQPVTAGGGTTQSPANLHASERQVSAAAAWVGDTLTHELWLANSGAQPSGQLRLEDALPAPYLAYVPGSLSVSGGTADYDAANHLIWWEGTLYGGGTIHITYETLIASSPGAPVDLVITSQVSGPPSAVLTLPPLASSTALLNAVDLALAPDAAHSGDPGATVQYTLVLTNGGNVTDTVSFQAASALGWHVTPPAPVALPPGAAAQLTLAVDIPAAALATAVEQTTLTAVSTLAPAVTAAATLTTGVNQVAGVALAAAAPQSGSAGTAITYTHQLQNSGNGIDTFELSAASSQGWLVSVSPDPTLAPGETATVVLVVHIPAGAAPGAVDTTTLTARSLHDGAITATAQDVTTVLQVGYSLYLPAIKRP
ncbi:MAG: DUF11 domain-containing protein, partial [Anaerolineales bacterium]|nr:DUF11 domain-containing protein [Anaerolineales bacterium]